MGLLNFTQFDILVLVAIRLFYNMNQLLFFIFGFFVGAIAACGIWMKKTDGRGYHAKRSSKKEERKEKILTLFAEKEKVRNNDVEKLLKISNATTHRYLDELEKENKIEQVGKTGKHTYYIRK